MPVMNGIESCQLLREFEDKNFLRPVFIVAHSGDDSSDHIRLCKSAGINDICIKPAKREQLE